jgi:ubiquinone/menaquinone biosynthesis C-methylase UbiE
MAETERSVAFDRAADFYDATRSFSPEAQRRMTEMLAAELRGRGLCLEIGVGTGRIALPLAEAGIPIAGVDISAPMIAKLLEKREVSAPVSLALADATRLPFADGSFGAAVSCHVLHLIPQWQSAVSELVRTLEPGGVILVDQGGWRQGTLRELEKEFSRIAGVGRPFVGVQRIEELDEDMSRHGATVRILPRVRDTRPISPGSVITLLEQKVFSFTWSLDDDTCRRAAEATREWARERFGSLDEPVDVILQTGWRAYDLL